MFMSLQFVVLRSLAKWLGDIWDTLWMGFSLPTSESIGSPNEPVDVKQEFDGWLHGDPAVTKNSVSRYGDSNHGYVTGNGLGSLEIGHSDD